MLTLITRNTPPQFSCWRRQRQRSFQPEPPVAGSRVGARGRRAATVNDDPFLWHIYLHVHFYLVLLFHASGNSLRTSPQYSGARLVGNYILRRSFHRTHGWMVQLGWLFEKVCHHSTTFLQRFVAQSAVLRACVYRMRG